MSTEHKPSDSQRAAGFWKWTRRSFGCFGVVALLSCGLLCAGGWFVWDYFSGLRDRTDQVHREALAGGDIDETYVYADARFRAKYSQVRFGEFERLRALMIRSNLSARSVETLTIDGETFVIVLAAVGGWTSDRQVGYYCRVVQDGRLHLLGIAPEMEEAVPGELQTVYRRMVRSSQRHDD